MISLTRIFPRSHPLLMFCVEQQQTACLVMADWVVDTCQLASVGRFAVTQEQGDTIVRLYKWAGEGGRRVSTAAASGGGDKVCFRKPASPPPPREKNMISGAALPFTNVEGEPVRVGGCMVLGRCSRTFTVIWDVHSMCCVSCGRHASKGSLEYAWLGKATAVCGVCGCLLL